MKRIVLIFSLLIGSIAAKAQVESGHNLVFDIAGIKYSYEAAIGGNWSLITRAGIESTAFAFYSDGNESSFYWELAPQIAIEPRIYTSFNRRQNLGRTTERNSSDFVGFPVQVFITGSPVVGFAPEYGIRRCLSKQGKWFHEVSFGPHILTNFETVKIRPRAQYKIGLRF